MASPKITGARFVLWEEDNGSRSVNDIVEISLSGDPSKDKAKICKQIRQFYDNNCDFSTPIQEISVVFLREGETS